MLFLTCSWRFLISNKLEQLQFKLEKNIGIEIHAGKVRKNSCEVCWVIFKKCILRSYFGIFLFQKIDKSQLSPYVLPDLLLNYPFNFQFGTIWGYKSPYKVIKFVLRLKCSAYQFHPPIFGACTYCTFNETIKLF